MKKPGFSYIPSKWMGKIVASVNTQCYMYKEGGGGGVWGVGKEATTPNPTHLTSLPAFFALPAEV